MGNLSSKEIQKFIDKEIEEQKESLDRDKNLRERIGNITDEIIRYSRETKDLDMDIKESIMLCLWNVYNMRKTGEKEVW